MYEVIDQGYNEITAVSGKVIGLSSRTFQEVPCRPWRRFRNKTCLDNLPKKKKIFEVWTTVLFYFLLRFPEVAGPSRDRSSYSDWSKAQEDPLQGLRPPQRPRTKPEHSDQSERSES